MSGLISSPQLFLEEHDVATPGCAILDISMPGLNRLELQRSLTAFAGSHRPIVFVTGKGDIPTSVRAMKAGALDFLTKPVNDEDLLEAISRAEVRDAASRALYSELESIQAKIKILPHVSAKYGCRSSQGVLTSKLRVIWASSRRLPKFTANR